MMMKLVVAILFSLVAAASVIAAEIPSPSERRSQSIHINSNELFSDSKKKTATFVGNVVAKQGDVTLLSDKMIVFQTAGGDVDRVECYGNVRIVQENRKGIAGKAVYEGESGKITLTENPKVYQGDDVVSGSVITYYIDDEKSVVNAAPGGRVEAVIHPKRKQDNAGTPKR